MKMLLWSEQGSCRVLTPACSGDIRNICYDHLQNPVDAFQTKAKLNYPWISASLLWTYSKLTSVLQTDVHTALTTPHSPLGEMMSLHKLIFPGGSQLLLWLQPIRDLFTPESAGNETHRHTQPHSVKSH